MLFTMLRSICYAPTLVLMRGIGEGGCGVEQETRLLLMQRHSFISLPSDLSDLLLGKAGGYEGKVLVG